MPDGYPQKASAWTGSLLARWQFAIALAKGQIPGCAVNLDELLSRVSALPPVAASELVLGRRPEASDDLLAALKEGGQDHATLVALCLASPEFQWR